MSGGVAYVLDEERTFSARCNPELVGLERLGSDDAETLRALVLEHRERIDSAVAARLLADWEPGLFVKVMPHDFKRALESATATGGAGFYTTESEGAEAAA